jgi:hypothetical protein
VAYRPTIARISRDSQVVGNTSLPRTNTSLDPFTPRTFPERVWTSLVERGTAQTVVRIHSIQFDRKRLSRLLEAKNQGPDESLGIEKK